MEIKIKPIRILHIMSGFGGGISTFIRNQAEALTDTSIIFDVATYDEANVTKLAKRIRVGIVLLAQTLDEACKDKGGENA